MTETAFRAAAESQKWALLIGINEYPKLAEQYQLHGCLNDVAAIEELLTSPQFAFPPQNILKLTSPAADPSRLATRENILAGFERHLTGNDRMRKEDIVVIYYSGHGSQIPDQEGDEEDGYDETIVPCDSGDRSKSEEVRDISDDEISVILDQLTERTQNINLIFDSCHSGTVTRALMDAESEDAQGRERYLPAATYPIPRPARRAASRSMGPSDWMPLSDGYVLLSACMAHERAREDSFHFWRRAQHGIMTYYLLEAMKEVGPETTYLDIWDVLQVKVTKHNRWQTPQIEGAFERKVFGGAALPRKRFVEVSAKSAEGVTLAAGLANGATIGSRFAIYRPGTQVFDDQSSRAAVIRLTRIGAFSSVGTVERGSQDDIEEGAPAIEIEHDYGDMQMSVDVVGDDHRLDAVREQIRTSSLLSLVENESDLPIARVRLRYPFDANGNQITSDGEKLFILSAGDGHPLVESITMDENTPPMVQKKLESIASYYNVLVIHNPDQQSKLKDKINLGLLRVIGKGENNSDVVEPVERNAGGDIVLKVGEKVIVEVENQSDQPLHLVILSCDSSWGMTPIFPEAGAPDSTVPAMSKRRLDRFTVNLHEYQKPLKQNQPLPREVLKAIATTERVEFRSLWQRSTRSLVAETSLDSLFERAMGLRNQQATRSLEKDEDPVVEDWTTAELVFHIMT